MLKPFKMSNFVPKVGFYMITAGWCIESIRGKDFVLSEMSNTTADIILLCVIILAILDLWGYFSKEVDNNGE